MGGAHYFTAHCSLPAAFRKTNRTATNDCATSTSDRDTEISPGEQFLQFDAALDSAKSGPLWLTDPQIADYAEYPIVRGAELGRYLLHAYVIMPNHVHILIAAR